MRPCQGRDSSSILDIRSIFGEVAEWLNALLLKSSKGESPSWVQIPPSPPFINNNMTFNQVREKLINGKHTIRYKSLTTEGKEHEVIGSLLNVNLFQSESDKILVFSPTENRWLDIEVSTIISVEPV